MPGFDGTGPLGQGPMTGWGRGFCAPGARRYGYRSLGPRGFGRGRGWGRGWGRGLGLGRGWGRGWGRGLGWWRGPAWLTPEEEKAFLEDEVAFLEKEINDMRQRLAELESESTSQAD